EPYRDRETARRTDNVRISADHPESSRRGNLYDLGTRAHLSQRDVVFAIEIQLGSIQCRRRLASALNLRVPGSALMRGSSCAACCWAISVATSLRTIPLSLGHIK